ncbi:MAG: DNA photolyase family protein [Saprospiraceae bacterium]|nr:DNA photolyase family protein [Saprospiraceae bacterium]
MDTINIFWFRRDLRLEDNAGLYHALKQGQAVLPIFIFDREILDKLKDKDDARVSFLHQTLANIQSKLNELGSSLQISYGKPVEVWKELLQQYKIGQVFTNRDYEPYAKERDAQIKDLLEKKNISFHTYKDHVIFESTEVLKKDGTPYTVFTPYSKKWLAKLDTQQKEKISYFLYSYPTEKYFSNFYKTDPIAMPSLAQMGFEPSPIKIPSTVVAQKVIKDYTENRNFPAIPNGTSRLGIHFRFGTISIRAKAQKSRKLNKTYLNELIWRDFYSMILDQFPHVVGNCFRDKYEAVVWRNDAKEFEAWCLGQTGYPMVDAGMRELNATGFMHNRVRMVVASFLVKHLLIDWRWGEAYFARKLLDFDLASNNGGWQWAAGCGTDAAPYFRIFNPTSQMEKFDKEKKYVKKWVPEYGTGQYVQPIVDHKKARQRCLDTYKKALGKA